MKLPRRSRRHLNREVISSLFLSEMELREMMEIARAYREDIEVGRFVIESRYLKQDWEIVIEPSNQECLLIVITAYRVK